MANTKGISQEEQWMIYYFEELQEAGLVKKVEYQPEPIILFDKYEIPFMEQKKTKTKISNKTLISKHIYTPDFLITWNSVRFHDPLNADFYKEWPIFFSQSNRSFVEVKSNFDRNNMTRHFNSAIQPWIFQQYGIYINLVKVPEIFSKTFIPKKVLPDMYYKVNTKKNKIGDKKHKFIYRTLQEYLEL